MIKIKDSLQEWSDIFSAYGFALYKGLGYLIEGAEMLVCATFWFASLVCVCTVDFVLCTLLAIVDFIKKPLE